MFLTDRLKSSYLNMIPLLIPWCFITGGLLFTLFQSFNLFNPLVSSPGWDAYQSVWSNIYFWQSLGFTLYVSLVSAFLSTLIGFLIASWFNHLEGVWEKLSLVYKIYLILPHLSVAYLVILLFSQTGLISALLYKSGIINDYSQFPSLLFDNRGKGIIIGYLIKEIPFSLLMAGALLRQIPKDTIITARMLGGRGFMILRDIYFPQALPALISSFFILFLYTFGAFEVPFILGGSKPVMMSIAVYDKLFRQDFSQRAEAMVILVTILIVNVISLILLVKLKSKFRFRRLII
jgi:putative spermidine/putrescine transport system permease protein